jgi:hypothetical protein
MTNTKSFFSSIQNWFTCDLHGRYLALILREIGTLQTEALTSFIAEVCDIPIRKLKNARFEREHSFSGMRGRRSADLAVFCEDEPDEPIVLIEIKYYDKPLPETEMKPAQLDDYLAWRNKDPAKRRVLLLTRELHRIRGIHVRRWMALARHLRIYSNKSDLIKMLVQYLEEEGNAMNKINGTAITKYVKRYLCHGRPGANNIEGPLEFANLLKNVQLMSGNFHTHFKESWREAGVKVEGEDYDRRYRVASIDFTVNNRLRTPRANQSVVDSDGWLREDLKDGGSISLFARHSLGHEKNWLRLLYGIRFDVAPADNEADPPYTFLFAELCGGVIGESIYFAKKINFDWVTEKAEIRSEKVEHQLNCLIVKLIDKTLEEKRPLLPQQKKALALLKKSLNQNVDLIAEEAA